MRLAKNKIETFVNIPPDILQIKTKKLKQTKTKNKKIKTV
jgi:hypothetical protein